MVCVCGGKIDLADSRILGIKTDEIFVLYCNDCKKVISIEQAQKEQKEQITNFFQWRI